MTDADITALKDASYRLLNHANLKAGEKENWRSTGSTGTVTAGNATRREGLACRILNYAFSVDSEPGKQRTGTLTWCKTANGWKIT